MLKAREQGAAVAVSIYVNAAQFNSSEDYKHYPRDLDADTRLCEREGIDVVFAPTDDEMYATGATYLQASTWVEESTLAKRLEGEKRPGHFRGVCTVVAKLFNIVQPDLALFGQKDYQQVRVIQRLVRDLCYPIKVVSVPTARESDGLALSSRNSRLSPSERAQAAILWKALSVAQDLFNEGVNNSHKLETTIARTVELAPSARLDYAEIANAETLEPVNECKRGDVILLAAHIGKVRLIDNLVL